jgi:general secretion pathway protein I
MAYQRRLADRRGDARGVEAVTRTLPLFTPHPLPTPASRRGGVRVALRATPAFHKSGGFTLIELVAAFVIFALGFGVLLQILSGALHTTTQSAEYTQAAMWAQSLLDTQGIGEPLQEGASSGRFDDRFTWDLAVTHYEPPPVQTTVQQLTTSNANGLITQAVTPLDLFRLELVVHWGTPYLMHHARFTTVRVMNPPLQAGNNIPAPPPIRSRQ